MESAARCAVHPGRPAVDDCPVCARPRCAADANLPHGGCAACAGAVRPSGPRRADRRAVVGAAVAAHLAVVPLAAIASQYVGARWFSVIAPFLLGISVGIVAEAGARKAHGLPIRLLAVGYALLGTAYGFVFVPGRQDPFTPLGEVGPPYVAAVLGAWLWTAPPRRVPKKED